jgi:Cu(I)/Ag(I) efflux system membrane fusion protein
MLQREELARTRKVPNTIQIVSPVDGFVLARNVSPGLKFDRGFEFYRIADLRRVWVLADVFLQDAQQVHAGMRAQVLLREQHISLPAVITDILPQFDAVSRTLKIRLELDNPGFVLRPDMFVDVNLPVALPSSIVVPADAVIDSGLSKTVFVETGAGSFEQRQVQTGWRDGDRVEIVSGLSPGERIAVSGTFFLDSESRMRAPATGAVATRNGAPAPTGHETRSGGGAGVVPPARDEAAHRAESR